MRRPLVIGAQKLYLHLEDSIDFASQLRDSLADRSLSLDVAVCPSFINLAHVAGVLKGSSVGIGAQNVHQEENGAFTGQVAIRELLDRGVQFVIVGHSELRTQQGEKNEAVNRKIRTCLARAITPIACVGENRQEREQGRSNDVVEQDLQAMLSGVSPEEFPVRDLVIAYEPVWAIRGGRDDKNASAANPSTANEMHEFIRGVVSRIYDAQLARQIRIIYGGSVSAHNAGKLLREPSIDGLLVGTASVRLDLFLQVIDACEEALSSAPISHSL